MLTPGPYLGQRIAYRRKKLGLRQVELAKLAGTKVKNISSIETGKHKPSILLLARIAVALDVSMEELNCKDRNLWMIKDEKQ